MKNQFKKTVFPNGLTVVTERLKEFRSLSVGIWARVGTRHEAPHEAGVSHYLEHMLFKGTGKRSALDIARAVDQVGGEFNAFTAREYTCFHVLLLSRDVDLAVDILRDVLLDSKFDNTEIERERKVILQEIAMVDETPEELAHDVFFEQVFANDGLGRPILGTESSIRKMERKTMVDYFRRHYRPDQLVVSVSGNVSHQQVVKKLGALTRKNWPGRPEVKVTKAALKAKGTKNVLAAKATKPPFAATTAKPPKMNPGCWWITRPTEQVHLVWGVPGTKYASKDRFAAFLLNVYLGGGMSSALFQEIREKNALAYTVYSTLSSYIDTGVFSIYAATGMNQVPLCLKLIEDCVGKLQRDLLSKEDLKTIQDNLKGTIQLGSDNVESRMSSIAKNEIFFGRYVPVDEVCRQIDLVKPEDIRRMARKLLSSGERSILLLGPKPTPVITRKLKSHGLKRLTR